MAQKNGKKVGFQKGAVANPFGRPPAGQSGAEAMRDLVIKYRVLTDRSFMDDIAVRMKAELEGKMQPIYSPILLKKMLPDKLDVNKVDRHVLQVVLSDGRQIDLREAFK